MWRTALTLEDLNALDLAAFLQIFLHSALSFSPMLAGVHLDLCLDLKGWMEVYNFSMGIAWIRAQTGRMQEMGSRWVTS